MLVVLALAAQLRAWPDEATLAHRFRLACKAVAPMATPRRPPATTYQAFLKALATWAPRLAAALRRRKDAGELARRQGLVELWAA